MVRDKVNSNCVLRLLVHFYDATKPDDALGGLIQNGSVTEGNFLQMLRIVLVTEAPVRVQHRTSGEIVSMSDSRLQIGIYDVSCGGTHLLRCLMVSY